MRGEKCSRTWEALSVPGQLDYDADVVARDTDIEPRTGKPGHSVGWTLNRERNGIGKLYQVG